MKFWLKDWDDYDEKIKDWICGSGTAAIEVAYLVDFELAWCKWYRSKDIKFEGNLPFGSYMMNKKWTMEEEFNNHMMRVQQVMLSSFISVNSLHFVTPGGIGTYWSSFQRRRAR